MKSLFINTGGIGDQILLLPTVKLLKTRYPNLEIDLITEPRSVAIQNLTSLYRRVKSFDFKSPQPDIFQLKKILEKHKYKHLIVTGSSLKSSFIAGICSSKIRLGFDNGFISNMFFTSTVKLNKNQYASNMFAELLTPIIPDLSTFLKNNQVVPNIEIGNKDIEWAKEILNPKLTEKYYARKILIHPGTSQLSIKKRILKGWSAKNWAALIEKLTEDENNIVMLLGSKEDTQIISEIEKNIMFFAKPKNFFDLSHKNYSIEQLAAIISYSDVLICNDSAPMHIGVGLRKKVLAFFGPTDPVKLLPNDSRFTAVHADNLSCRPCLFDKRKQSCSKPVCLNVDVDTMIASLNKAVARQTIND